MAVVKIGDSVLVRLAYETVSMVLAKKSAIPSFVWVSVVFLRGTNEDWDCCCRQAGDGVAVALPAGGAQEQVGGVQGTGGPGQLAVLGSREQRVLWHRFLW